MAFDSFCLVIGSTLLYFPCYLVAASLTKKRSRMTSYWYVIFMLIHYLVIFCTKKACTFQLNIQERRKTMEYRDRGNMIFFLGGGAKRGKSFAASVFVKQPALWFWRDFGKGGRGVSSPCAFHSCHLWSLPCK